MFATVDVHHTDARDQLAEVVSLAAYKGQVTFLTRHGKRVAAIVPADDAEEIERLEDEWLAKQAKAARARIGVGEATVSFVDVLAKLGITEDEMKSAAAAVEQEQRDLEAEMRRAA